METRSKFFAGLHASLPIVIGFIGIGIAAGIVETKAGLTPLESVLLSSVLYAGASQFVFASLWSLQTDPFTLITTVFFMNLRHLLYSTAMTTRLKKRKWYEYLGVGCQLVDETFSLATTKFNHQEQIHVPWMVGLNLGPYLTWNLGTLIGIWVFELFQHASVSTEVFSFALVGMFCSLLVLQIVSKKEIIFYSSIALLSAVSCVLFRKVGCGSGALPVTIVACSTVGYLLLNLMARKKR